MSPYAAPIIVVPRKSKPGVPLAETKRSAIDYCELNKQIPKVQSSQAKSEALIEIVKIEHTLSKLKVQNIFLSLTSCQNTITSLYIQIQD